MTEAQQTPTGLAGSRSPFLQHGATQPVAWMPWGDAAFERAKREDRPVLLDIGAVWCHWCHVMDAESYENEETARLINEHFVPVKVDRDERPDVDARYQRAVQLLTNQGGWPLTAFLTPDGEVFYGGTYFPPEDMHGRPSFRRVLREVARIWTEDRPRAAHAASSIRDRLETYARAEAQAGDPDPALINETSEELAQAFDFRYGGFGRAPRFPNAGALDLLLDEGLDNGTDWAFRIVEDTLDAMAKGGICDQLGGAFHRYATDARWNIPHFEKMAYDNGPLLCTYARASAARASGLWSDTAAGIVDYYASIAPALHRDGGFPASQDADFGFDNDGDYWTWTADEVRAALDDATAFDIARLHFGLDSPHSAMHLDRSRHVLFRAQPAEEVAARLGLDTTDVEQRLAAIRARLLAARNTRPRPLVDETLYSGWVALVASGHLAAARWIGRRDAAASALRALDRVWDHGFVDDTGVLHRVGDTASGVLLEDQAHLAQALVDAYEYTQDVHWLERAHTLVRLMLERFRAPNGALRDRSGEPADGPAEAALARIHTPIADSPTPSGNGTAALVLHRLHALTRDALYASAAGTILNAFAASAARMGSGAATWMKALAWSVRPVTTVVLVEDGPAADSALLAAALGAVRPRTSVRRIAPAAVDPAALPPELAAMVGAEAPRAYVCAGRTCAAPVREPEALAEVLRTLRG